jgi:hypothetical protein
MLRGSHDGLMIDGLASEPQSTVRVARFTLRTDYMRRVAAAPDQPVTVLPLTPLHDQHGARQEECATQSRTNEFAHTSTVSTDPWGRRGRSGEPLRSLWGVRGADGRSRPRLKGACPYVGLDQYM